MFPLEVVSTTRPPTLEDALGLLLVALVVWLTNTINNRGIKRKVEETKQEVGRSKSKVEDIDTTLNTNNGGSTVRDKLDSLLRWAERNDNRLERIETTQDRQDSKIDAVDKKLNDHIHHGLGRIKKRKRL